ncbi:type I polyketide synthase [Streptomyces olivaceiscleroticus]|uniref:Phthiocerol type I polyketide synthase PpsA n=1 Tax=Streptomyces olivaceiscleroticus TaxID=68245 RepID=A0ABN0ZPP5_9ACTN
MATSLEPIAVIGTGCRFAAGIDSPEALWEFLNERRDAVRDIPPERWSPYKGNGSDAAVVRNTTARGAYLADIAGFDAEFFGISPREAQLMDPQQRLCLEVAWEALERAGLPPHALAGTDTGVFIGIGSDDYGRRLLEDLPGIEAWTGIGAALCGTPNRLSHALDLRGPSIAVDTACSSSLVAVHQACQALRTDGIPLALAGGVSLIAAPGLAVVLDAAGAVAKDGRSKAFDAAADGYGRGEGCAVLVLKRLADAERDGDHVHAVIVGSAVHQDGRTEGIMAPSRAAQEHLLRTAYRVAGIAPDTVDYVEAHGTGTPVGDPAEAGALAAVLGAGRPPHRRCLIGSLKPHIGHLEAAAGAAGLLKAVLAVERGKIPPTLTTDGPNPAIPWADSGLTLVTGPTVWPATGDRPRRAGVASYGYGGTIAHAVLQSAPRRTAPPDGTREAAFSGSRQKTALPGSRRDGARGTADAVLRPLSPLFPLSGATEAGLRATAGRLATWLDAHPDPAGLAAVGRTLAHHRTHLPVRAVVRATSPGTLATHLRALAEGRTDHETVTGRATRPAADPADPVWVFSGHGAQWSGMGRGLLADEPAFAAALDRLDPVFREEAGYSPRDLLLAGDVSAADRVQTLTYAVQTGLAAVWRSYGVRPAAVIGHSVGEFAAAVAAGALTEADGARLVCRRSLLLRPLAGTGAMALTGLGFEEAAARLAGHPLLAAAVQAAPGSTVVSGEAAAVRRVTARWAAEGIPVRPVASDLPFHSPLMGPLRAELVTALKDIEPAPGTAVPLYTTALPDPRDRAPRDAEYWAANLCGPVRFAQAVAAAVADGHRAFLELSAHPIVTHSIEETLTDAGVRDTCVAHSVRRRSHERATVRENLAALHCHGVRVDWSALHRPAGPRAELPTYAWQHRRHWADPSPARAGSGAGHDPASHTLLGDRLTVDGTSRAHVWRTRLDHANRPYPGGHAVAGTEIVPAAVLLHTLLSAAVLTDARPALRDVALRVPVSTGVTRDVQVVCQDGALRLSSRTADRTTDTTATADAPAAADAPATGAARPEDGWLTHTTAFVAAREPGGHPAEVAGTQDATPGAAGEPCDPESVVTTLAALGVASMGFPWRIRELRRAEGALTASVAVGTEGADSWAPVLDAALSAASLCFPGPPTLRMPARIGSAVLLAGRAAPPAEALIHIRRDPAAGDSVDVDIADAHGVPAARLRGVRFGSPEPDPGTAGSPAALLHDVVWRPYAPDAARETPLRRVVLVGGDRALAAALAPHLDRADIRLTAVPDAAGLASLEGGSLRRGLSPADAVVVAPSPLPPPATVAEAAAHHTASAVRVARLLSTAGAGRPPALWWLTRGAGHAHTAAGLAQAPLWGLGPVVAGEHPELGSTTVDLPGEPAAADLAALTRLLRSACDEDVIAVSGGVPTTARLAPSTGLRPGSGPVCRADGTYLVTGGLGALGLHVAQWLADRGARRLVLTGRSPLPPRTDWDAPHDPATARRIETLRALEAAGVTVRTLAADIADHDRIARLLAPDALGLPPVRGVVHAAGVADNALLRDLDEETVRAVLRPKVDGALVLDRLFPPGSVDFFVLFSSAGQLLRMPGQAAYAAANAFLDALARHRRVGGHQDTLAPAWTSWRGLGLSTSAAAIDAELRARGTADITAAQALRAWDSAGSPADGRRAVLRVLPTAPGTQRPPLLRELTPDTTSVGAPEGAGAWRELTGATLRDHLLTEVRQAAAETLRTEPEAVDPHRPLAEAGLDSLLSVTLRGALQERLGVALPAALLWNRPTVTEIAGHLAELSARPQDPAAPSTGTSKQ